MPAESGGHCSRRAQNPGPFGSVTAPIDGSALAVRMAGRRRLSRQNALAPVHSLGPPRGRLGAGLWWGNGFAWRCACRLRVCS